MLFFFFLMQLLTSADFMASDYYSAVYNTKTVRVAFSISNISATHFAKACLGVADLFFRSPENNSLLNIMRIHANATSKHHIASKRCD